MTQIKNDELYIELRDQVLNNNNILNKLSNFNFPLFVMNKKITYILFQKDQNEWKIFPIPKDEKEIYPLNQYNEYTTLLKDISILGFTNVKEFIKSLIISNGIKIKDSYLIILTENDYFINQPLLVERSKISNIMYEDIHIVSSIILGNWNVHINMKTVETVKKFNSIIYFIIQTYSLTTNKYIKVFLLMNNKLTNEIALFTSNNHNKSPMEIFHFKRIQTLPGTEIWEYYPTKGFLHETEKSQNKEVAILRNSLYPASGRPITSMSTFLPTLSIKEEKGEKKEKLTVIEINKDPKGRPQKVKDEKGNIVLVFPVIRYAQGKDESFFYKKEKSLNHYCGTYYFWEPDSQVYLNLGNSKFYPNKFIAYLSLSTQPYPDIIKYMIFKYYKTFKSDQLLNKNSTNYSSIIKFYSYYERSSIQSNININEEFLKELIILFNDDKKSDLFLMDQFYHTTEATTIYKKGEYVTSFDAFEDDLDQPLCEKAKNLGIDTIILALQPGSTRVNTEVLDTRKRTISLQNLFTSIA